MADHPTDDLPSPRFDDGLRARLAERCAGFPRIARGSPDAPLKAAAVAVVLVRVDDPAAELAALATEKLTPSRGAVAFEGAIPAVMAYNYFADRVRVLGTEMENFASEFLNIAERHFLK